MSTAGHLPGRMGTACWMVREMPTPAVGQEQPHQGQAIAALIGSVRQRKPVCLTAPMRPTRVTCGPTLMSFGVCGSLLRGVNQQAGGVRQASAREVIGFVGLT